MRGSLCILQYNTPTDEVRDKTKRYLNEIRPNVFIGVISARVRDSLWNTIEKTGTKAVIYYSDKNEQGYSYKTTLEEEDNFVDYDGVKLSYRGQKPLCISDLYAKPSKKLIDHLIEAGTMAEAICRSGRGFSAVKAMSERFNISVEDIIKGISFFCALHDIGKAHPGFIKTMNENSVGDINDITDRLLNNKMVLDNDKNIRHERYSAEIINEYFINKGIPDNISSAYSSIIAYHHQGKDLDGNDVVHAEKYNISDKRWLIWNEIHQEIISEIEKHWEFPVRIFDIYGHTGFNGFLYFILSVMVTSDWIVSGSMWQEYLSNGNGKSLKQIADEFLSGNCLKYESIAETFKDVKWKDAFDFPMNELQKAIKDNVSGHNDFLLFEYPMGYGKTAAAMLASVLMGIGKGSIYMGTPTMTTAKALSDECRKIMNRLNKDMIIPELDSSMIWNDNDMEKIPKELWTSRSKHQLLYPYSVGTIDQLLKSILMFRYSCIGLLGLSDKVVVIDEVHAYETFMLEEIKTLIKWCRMFKVPVICLSATLPDKIKRELFEAAGVKRSNLSEISEEYPLVSIVKDKELIQMNPGCVGRDVPVECKKTDNLLETMYNYAVNLKEGCLAIIVPRVDDSFHLYRRLQKVLNADEVILYQGRDTNDHKDKKIRKLLKLCGKDRSHRPKKLIVVATSIIEQSLDVDFDYMITSIAPIDLIIQRIGRLWRHDDKGTIREYIDIEKPFTVVIPKDYEGLTNIYNREVLFETEKVLDKTDNINTVTDIRSMINEVYDNIVVDDENFHKLMALRNCLPTPFTDVSTILTSGTSDYIKFNGLIPQTREESYPTTTVCLLSEVKDEYTWEEVREIRNKNVVNVPEYKLRGFTPVTINDKAFNDLTVYIGEGLSVKGEEGVMTLTDDGLEFTEE